MSVDTAQVENSSGGLQSSEHTRPVDLNTQPGVSMRKWFPTGILAWQVLRQGRGLKDKPNFYDAVNSERWVLVHEFVEVAYTDDDCDYTGRNEWRPIPVLALPPRPSNASRRSDIVANLYDSPLINPQATHHAGPIVGSDPATG